MNTDTTQISQSQEATTRQILKKLQSKWRKYKRVELLLWALSISALTMAAVYLAVRWSAGALAGAGALLTVLVWVGLLWWRGLRQITLYDVAQYLNKHHPVLENSSELLLLPEEDLNLLAKMQRQKVSNALIEVATQATLPHQLPKAALTLLGSGVLASLLFTLSFGVAHLPKGTPTSVANDTLHNTTQLPQQLPASIQSIQAIVQAPAYTRLGTQVAPELNIKAVENSVIRWKVRFKGDIAQAAIVLNTGDSLRLQPSPQQANEYVAQWRLKEKGFYQLVFRQTSQKAALSSSNEWQSSEFFALTPVPDARPKLSLVGINDYEEFEFKPNINISLSAKITDDYGITDAYIVATVSKGQGESVKFREQKLRFGNFVPGGRSHQLHKTLNLQQLGMAPGDELYFLWRQ